MEPCQPISGASISMTDGREVDTKTHATSSKAAILIVDSDLGVLSANEMAVRTLLLDETDGANSPGRECPVSTNSSETLSALTETLIKLDHLVQAVGFIGCSHIPHLRVALNCQIADGPKAFNISKLAAGNGAYFLIEIPNQQATGQAQNQTGANQHAVQSDGTVLHFQSRTKPMDRTLSDFVSHSLQEPIRVVSVLSDYLSEEWQNLSPDQRDYYTQELGRYGQEARRLVAELAIRLEVAELDASNAELGIDTQ